MPPPLFVGSGVALITPFASGKLDEEGLRALVRFHLEAGTDALVVNGSTGEAPAMSPEEQRRAVECVVEVAAGRLPVIAGTGGSDTAVVARLGRSAREAGADAILLAPPPYNKPTQQGIIAHCRAVIDAADLPTILYNVPSRTACQILPETAEELAADPRIVGVKEASGDISQVAELARRLGGRVAIYSGTDDQILAVLALGGVGVISVLANAAPADTARMVHAFREGRVEESRELQLRYLPLITMLFREPNPAPIKAAVGLLGFASGEPRLPLLTASGDLTAEIEREMRALGLLSERGAGTRA